MNLTEALDVLPEVTAPAKKKRRYKSDPRLVGREHVEEGETILLAHVPGSVDIFRFSPEQWQLVHLFDGERTYEQIAEAFFAKTGIRFEPNEIREYADGMEEANFWYKTPQEKNIALSQKLHNHRKNQKKAKAGDMARIAVAHWDADEFIDKLHGKLDFVYTWWFTALTLALFTFMVYVFIDRWAEIGSDTLKYYTFTEKSFYDLVEFWLLFFGLAFFHESAHALTCKHYKGGVHDMGFHLIYLTPAFYVDVTEAWVYTNRWQRVVTMMAGIWIELMVCAVGTVVWWGTPTGSFAHEFAYKLMLITGIAVVLMNMNPLIKLDGYYILSEIVGIDDIKERSTAYVSSWVQRNIFGLPVEVEYITPRRRWFFVPYAILSGLYSYLLLYAVARFAGNVFRHYSPDWAFVPTMLLALLIFKSRIRKLLRFMKTVYLDKKDKLKGWFTPPRAIAASIFALVLLFAPLWRDSVEARFILEPAHRAVVRNEVPGTVLETFAREGQKVEAGEPLLRMANLQLESERGRAAADYAVAAARATDAQLRYTGFGPADQQRQQALERRKLLNDRASKLVVRAPIGGVVVTPKLIDLRGSRLEAGSEIAEIADLSNMQARIFVPESEIRDVRVGAPAKLHFDSMFSFFHGTVASIAPASSEIAAGLLPHMEYKGVRPPMYYAVSVLQKNPQGDLKDGMSGTVRIYSVRRSVFGFVWRVVHDFVARKFW